MGHILLQQDDFLLHRMAEDDLPPSPRKQSQNAGILTQPCTQQPRCCCDSRHGQPGFGLEAHLARTGIRNALLLADIAAASTFEGSCVLGVQRLPRSRCSAGQGAGGCNIAVRCCSTGHPGATLHCHLCRLPADSRGQTFTSALVEHPPVTGA